MSTKRRFGRELWERTCDFAAEPDGLPVYDCGPWTIEKLFFLCQYLAQTTQAMVGNPRFSSTNYVDLYCGPGICAVSGDGRAKRYPGSALLAAGCEKPFDHIVLVDCKREFVDAAASRIRKFGRPSKLQLFTGDTNTLASEVAAVLPPNALTVAFVDPFSLDIHFETIDRLAARPLDLIILFADRMDLERNVESTYYAQQGGKLDLFLGPKSNWRPQWDALHNRDEGRIRELFAEIYLKQLRDIGYCHCATQTITSDRGPLYRLVYASKHELGLKFWRIALSEDLGGNRTLFRPD